MNETKKKKRTLAQQKADLDHRFEVDKRSGLVRALLESIRAHHHRKDFGAGAGEARSLYEVLVELDALTGPAPTEEPAQQELATNGAPDGKSAAAGPQ